MAEVLVLVDHANGEVRKTTAELLTIARRLGEPSAVYIGSGIEDAQGVLGRFGSHKVYVADSPEVTEYLVAPQVDILADLIEETSPAAVLIPSNPAGKELAARLSIRCESGLFTDAVDVQAGPTTTQSVFAGSYTTTSSFTKGTPIICVKPNSAAPEQANGAGAFEELSVSISDGAKAGFGATGGSSTKGTIGGEPAADSSAGSREGPPAWARRMQRSRSIGHGATVAAHAVRAGDSHGGGSSVNLSESDR